MTTLRHIQVLIISDVDDPVTDRVHRALTASGGAVVRWNAAVDSTKQLRVAARQADSLVLLTSVRHNSFSGALKVALDALEVADVRAKPVGLVSTGNPYGTRALDHLRVVMGALETVMIPQQVDGDLDLQIAPFVEALTWFAARSRPVPAQREATHDEAPDLSPSVSRAVAYLCANFSDNNLSLDLVARSVHLSRFHFSRTFRKETGRRFIDYLTALRMSEARSLLAATDLPVSEVCRRVGYHESSHFQRTFRNSFGMSPSEYRTRGRAGVVRPG
ncbi:helix-turn-helix domain-containing protein [Saccharothrix sp. BKS2]|uniref:helix-turn-helix domain-containing protein n=1 Tax=Saccharothrix sp. BKS2 TaxID=3064400 RepID=UPI0039EBD784